MAGQGVIPGGYEGILGEMWNRGTSGQERRTWGASRENVIGDSRQGVVGLTGNFKSGGAQRAREDSSE